MKKLEGIVVPLLTPLRGRDELDVAALDRLIEHVIAGGVSGVFVLGTTGEAPALSYRLRRELIQRACRQVNRRVPVLVGLTDTSVAEAVSLGRYSEQQGADAVVSSTPYYFPVEQEELASYVQALTNDVPLPLILYNIPQMTKISFAIDTVRRLMDLDRVIGIKDSSGDVDYLNELLSMPKKSAGWVVFAGHEHLLVNCVQRGGTGGVTGGANVWPELYVKLDRAARAGDQTVVAKLNADLARFAQIYVSGQGINGIVKSIKCAAALRGLCQESMAQPLASLSKAEREKVSSVLKELALLSNKEVHAGR